MTKYVVEERKDGRVINQWVVYASSARGAEIKAEQMYGTEFENGRGGYYATRAGE